MTLTEYLAQENPVKMPSVTLSRSEFEQGHFFGAVGHRLAAVYIDAIGSTYCVKEGEVRLWTIDRDGNPKSPSCFYLPE